MATEQDYLALNKRLEAGKQQLAVLTAREQQRAEERKGLADRLTAAGIDLTKPEEELARLEQEIRDDFQRQEATVAAFEQRLRSPTASPSQPTTATVVKESATPAPTVDGLDLDIT